jgi:hypothetical protein
MPPFKNLDRLNITSTKLFVRSVTESVIKITKGIYSFDQDEKPFKFVQKETPPYPPSGASLVIVFDVTDTAFEFFLLCHRFPKNASIWEKEGEKKVLGSLAPRAKPLLVDSKTSLI